MAKESPSMDAWLKEAKAAESAPRCGMYLAHNDHEKVEQAAQEALTWEGIEYVKYWLNEGTLNVGDDIMYVFIGGDIRPHVIDALQKLVGKIKNELVSEVEISE